MSAVSQAASFSLSSFHRHLSLMEINDFPTVPVPFRARQNKKRGADRGSYCPSNMAQPHPLPLLTHPNPPFTGFFWEPPLLSGLTQSHLFSIVCNSNTCLLDRTTWLAAHCPYKAFCSLLIGQREDGVLQSSVPTSQVIFQVRSPPPLTLPPPDPHIHPNKELYKRGTAADSIQKTENFFENTSL